MRHSSSLLLVSDAYSSKKHYAFVPSTIVVGIVRTINDGRCSRVQISLCHVWFVLFYPEVVALDRTPPPSIVPHCRTVSPPVGEAHMGTFPRLQISTISSTHSSSCCRSLSGVVVPCFDETHNQPKPSPPPTPHASFGGEWKKGFGPRGSEEKGGSFVKGFDERGKVTRGSHGVGFGPIT